MKASSGSSKLEYLPEKKAYHAYVKAKPERGKANAELLNLIRKELGHRAAIVSGFGSNRKTVELI